MNQIFRHRLDVVIDEIPNCPCKAARSLLKASQRRPDISTDTQKRAGLQLLVDFLLNRQAALVERILAENPAGFSTTRGDLLRDILP